MMLQTVQGGMWSFVLDVMLDSARWKGVGGERRVATACLKGKGVVWERRDVRDRVKGVVFGGEIRDVADSAWLKVSLGRDVMLQTVQGGRGR